LRLDIVSTEQVTRLLSIVTNS